jgi:hypothetical protein
MTAKEADEKTPLLDEEKGETNPPSKKSLTHRMTDAFSHAGTMGKTAWSHTRVLPGSIIGDILHRMDLAPSFGEYVELSVRAAVVTCLFGAFILDEKSETRPWAKYSEYMADMITPVTLAMFFFSLGKTFGDTMYNVYTLLVGTSIASFTIWVCFGFFPDGWVAGGPSWIFWMGIIGGAIYVILTLFLNMDLNIKIFILSNWVFFWMKFVNGEHDANVSNAFTFNSRGPIMAAMIQSAVAAFAGLLVSLAPYPIMAKEKAGTLAVATAGDVVMIWNELTRAYWSKVDTHIYMFDRLLHDVEALRAATGAMRSYNSMAWWETLGFGQRESARECIDGLADALDKDLDHLPSVLAAVTKSQQDNSAEEDSKHDAFSKVVLPQVEGLNNAIQKLMTPAVEIACRGGPTAIEAINLQKDIDGVRKAVDSLRDTVVANRPNTGTSEKKFDLEWTDEYSFLFCQSHFGRSTMSWASKLLYVDQTPKSIMYRLAFIFVPLDVFDKSVILSADNVKFTIRNSLGIVIAWMIGYTGFPPGFLLNRSGEGHVAHSELLAHHRAYPAMILTLMLSNFVGSAIDRTTKRVLGTILGIIFAMMIHGMVGKSWTILALSLGTWTGFTVFMYFHCSINASIFLMMGYFGAGQIVEVKCGGDLHDCTYHDKKEAAMDFALDGMFALIIMVIVDLVMNAKPGSKQAAANIMQAWAKIVGYVDHLFDNEIKNSRHNDGSIRAEFAVCKSLGLEAAGEPRYWKAPWREVLYNRVLDRSLLLRMNMQCMHYSAAVGGKNGKPKADFFIKLCEEDSFQKLGGLMTERMNNFLVMLAIFGHESQSRFDKMDDPAYMQNFLTKEEDAMQEFVDVVNKPENAWMLQDIADEGDHDDDSLEKDAITKLSMICLCIDTMFQEMRELQHELMRSQ